MHRQIGMLADSACGTHAKSDSVMHRMSAGTHTNCGGVMHMTWAGESDGIADRPGRMHRQIGMAAGSACSAQTMDNGTMHKMSGAVLAQGGALAQGCKGAPNAAFKHGEAMRSLAEHGAARHGTADNSGQRHTQP